MKRTRSEAKSHESSTRSSNNENHDYSANQDPDSSIMQTVLKFFELVHDASFTSRGREKIVYSDAFSTLLGSGGCGDAQDKNNRDEQRGKNKDSADGDVDDELHSIVTILLEFLSSPNYGDLPLSSRAKRWKAVCPQSNVGLGASQATTLSKLDVSKLLLPWSMRSILRRISVSFSSKTSDSRLVTLEWRILEMCLIVLAGANRNRADTQHDARKKKGESILPTFFSQSTLNKLVPEAARVALDPSGNISSDVEGSLDDRVTRKARSNSSNLEQMKAATGCFNILMSLHRPTMDIACNDLLVLVDELIRSATPGYGMLSDVELEHDFHIGIVSSTVELIWRLMRAGAANPKKMFGLLASPGVFSSLARFYAIRISQGSPVANDNRNTKDLVKKVVWSGLFHPSHHIGGFRSMNINCQIISSEIERSPTKKPKEGVDEPDDGNVVSRKNRKKYCYQEELFSTLDELIESYSRTGKRERCDIMSMATFVPVIIEGFIYQTKIWQEDSLREKGNMRSNDRVSSAIVFLQFRFWSSILEPFLKRLPAAGAPDTIFGLAVVRTIHDSLVLLRKHDLYLPSYDDPGQAHFRCLNSISDILISRAEIIGSHSSTGFADKEGIGIIQAFASLLDINHHLLHDKLPNVFICIGRCLTDKPAQYFSGEDNSCDLPQLSSNLVCSMVGIYGRLRQLQHFFSTLLSSVTISSDPNSHEIIPRIMQNNSVCNAIVRAVKTCPQGQVKPIWIMFNQYISSCGQKDPKKYLDSLKFVVDSFIIFMRSLRVENFHAQEIKDLCENAMDTSVRSLLQLTVTAEGQDYSSLSSKSLESIPTNAIHGIILSGWLVDLHTRCTFWLDLTFDDIAGCSLLTRKSEESSSTILDFLLGVARSDLGNELDKVDRSCTSLIGALQHLSCHRIEQLHSLIYENERLERISSELDEELGSIKILELTSEAELLVDFSARAALYLEKEVSVEAINIGSAGWFALARTLSLWLPYSEIYHVDAFLRWILETFSSLNDDIPVELSNSAALARQGRDRELCLSLMSDASFFENTMIAERLVSVSLEIAVDLMGSALGVENGVERSKSSIKSSRYQCLASLFATGSSRQPLSSQLLENIDLGNREHGLLQIRCERNDASQATNLLRLLNGLPSDLFSSSLCPSDLDKILRLDLLAHALISVEPEEALQFASACKIAMARSLESLRESNQLSSLFTPGAQRTMFWRIYKSVRCVVSSSDSLHAYLSASGSLVGQFFASALFAKDTASLVVLSELIIEIMNDGQDVVTSTPFKAKIILLRHCVCTISVTSGDIIRSRIASDNSKTSDICFDRKIFDTKTWNRIVNYVISCDDKVAHLDIFPEMLKLYSDLISLANFDSRQMTQDDIIDDLFSLEKVFASVTKLALSGHLSIESSPVLLSSIYYMVAANPNIFCEHISGVAIQLYDLHRKNALALNEHCSAIHNAAFSAVVQGIDATETCTLLSSIYNQLKQGSFSSRRFDIVCATHSYYLATKVATGQRKKKVIADYSKLFFSLALEVLCPLRCFVSSTSVETWSKQIATGAQFVSAVIVQRDVIPLSVQDIVSLLSSTISVLSPIEMKKMKKDHQNYVVSDGPFNSCCDIVSSLLKHYPKQLYGCASLLASVIQSLMFHSTATGTCSISDNTKKAMRLTKTLELLSPHKEVFKKHTIGSILYFIDSLEAGMSAATKKNLTPAIFALLDMCSKHELHQIQVTMSTSSKSLFESVFRGFQKEQYKGKY